MKIVRTTYLSLGSNQGNKLDNLQKAIDLIGEKVGAIHKVSSIYKTKSWGFDGDAFFNCCLEASTNLNPETLLKTLLEIEERKFELQEMLKVKVKEIKLADKEDRLIQTYKVPPNL